ncbi:PREDICTED: tubulin beta-1 chain-like [Priapulus caudatus]|uniref:Tubulin beta-1 chain-like n=1 Tax=Priapulus caudatus TaxID=37621 RepID=A0ABM1E2E7_PRICU|nr:PREDICTED: tubulin beta-1 chain-like [Priapulus caudatus]
MNKRFWEAICEDHCINDVGRFEGMAYEEEDRLAKIQTYFQEGEWEGGSSGVWAKAYYEKESRMSETVLEYVRKIAEKCDRLQMGFSLMHASWRSTGAGMGSRALKKLKDEYPKQINMTSSVFPSQRISETRGPSSSLYNTVLSLRHLTEFSTSRLCLDNESLYSGRNANAGRGNAFLTRILNQLTKQACCPTRPPT